MLLKALIIDDEEDARENLSILIGRYCPEIEIIGCVGSSSEAAKMIHQMNPDVLFLDVLMTGETGFDLLNQLPGNKLSVIFTSAHSEFALKAIKHQAFDYLLKPIDISELKDTIRRLLEHLQGTTSDEVIEGPKKIMLSNHGLPVVKNREEIMYCEADSNYTIFHFSNAEKIITSKTLKEYEQFFKGSFVRIHSKFLVNLIEIAGFSSGGTAIELKNGTSLPVSRRKKAEILQLLLNQS